MLTDPSCQGCWRAVVLAISLLAAGCQSDGRPEVIPVAGSVVYQGQPVSGAAVIFLGKGDQPAAVATTDANGAFRLTTYDEDDGAVAGEYVVMVSKLEGGSPAAAASEPFDPVADMEAVARSKPSAAAARSLLPPKYATAATSPLQFTIGATGESKLTIELTD